MLLKAAAASKQPSSPAVSGGASTLSALLSQSAAKAASAGGGSGGSPSSLSALFAASSAAAAAPAKAAMPKGLLPIARTPSEKSLQALIASNMGEVSEGYPLGAPHLLLSVPLLTPPLSPTPPPFPPPLQALKTCASGGLAECLYLARSLAVRSPGAGAVAPAFAGLPTFEVLCLLQRFSLLLRPGESEVEGAADQAASLLLLSHTLEALQARSDRGSAQVAGSLQGVVDGLRAALQGAPKDNAWAVEVAEDLQRKLNELA